MNRKRSQNGGKETSKKHQKWKKNDAEKNYVFGRFFPKTFVFALFLYTFGSNTS